MLELDLNGSDLTEGSWTRWTLPAPYVCSVFMYYMGEENRIHYHFFFHKGHD